MAQNLMMLVYVLGTSGLTLTGLALRLWWQARRDQRRLDVLGRVITRVPASSVIEIHDVRDDGSQLQVRITPGPTSRRSNDE
jgi:hypothetical protein